MMEFDNKVTSEFSEQVESILDTSSMSITSVLIKNRSQVWDHFEQLNLNEKKRESAFIVGELYYNNRLIFFFLIFTLLTIDKYMLWERAVQLIS